jgi:hypothetical protein
MQNNLSYRFVVSNFIASSFFISIFVAGTRADETSSKPCRESLSSLINLELLDFEGADVTHLKTLFVSRARQFLEAPSLRTEPEADLQQRMESILKPMLLFHDRMSNLEYSDKHDQIFLDQTFEHSILNLAKIFFESQGTRFSLEEVRDPKTKKNYFRGVIYPSAGFFGVMAANIQDHYNARLLWDIRYLRLLQAEAAFDPSGIVYLGRHIFSDRAKDLTSSLWHEIDHAHVDRLGRQGVLLPIHGHVIQPLLPVAEAYSTGFDLAELRTLAKDAIRTIVALRRIRYSEKDFDSYFLLLRHPVEDLVSFSQNWFESLNFFEGLFDRVHGEAIEVSEKSGQVKMIAPFYHDTGNLLDIRIKASEALDGAPPVLSIQLRHSMDIRRVLELGISPASFKKPELGHGFHFKMYGDLVSPLELVPLIVDHLKQQKKVALQNLEAAQEALIAFREFEEIRASPKSPSSDPSGVYLEKWKRLEKKIQALPIYALTIDELRSFHQRRRALSSD